MAKLGTNRNPAVVRVQTQARAEEIFAICEDCGWKVVVGIEPDKAENIADLGKLIRKETPLRRSDFTPRRSRNDYCPCGSGKKYMNCCWEKDHRDKVGAN